MRIDRPIGAGYISSCIQRGLRPRQPALTGNGGEDDVARTGNNRSCSPMRVQLKESIHARSSTIS